MMTFHDTLLNVLRTHSNQAERVVLQELLATMVARVDAIADEERARVLGQHLIDAHDEAMRHRRALLTDSDVALVTIEFSGDDGEVFPLEAAEVMLGRDADLSFPQDDFLSPRHVKLWREDGRLFARDLDSINGTFVRVLSPTPLEDGDVFLVGRQVLKFSLLSASPAQVEGVRRMGSPSPDTSHPVVSQLGPQGEVYSTRRIEERGLVIGREPSCDAPDIALYPFADDHYQSQSHLKIHRSRGEWMLDDLSSSNGTWIKITERELHDGDQLFIGTQLFRVVLHSSTPR